jgi:hypothetical protein
MTDDDRTFLAAVYKHHRERQKPLDGIYQDYWRAQYFGDRALARIGQHHDESAAMCAKTAAHYALLHLAKLETK